MGLLLKKAGAPVPPFCSLGYQHGDKWDSSSGNGILFALQSMVGSDIAELLMQDCKKLEKYKRQPPVANLISLTDEDWPVLSSGTRDLLTGEIPPSVETPAQIVEKFTKLLYYGRKKASARLLLLKIVPAAL